MDAVEKEMVAVLVGPDADAADQHLAEVLVHAATNITHECGTEEATVRAIWSTIDDFLARAAMRRAPGPYYRRRPKEPT